MTTVEAPTLSKREWLASQTGPDGKPLAKSGPGVRGRFSQAATAALTKAIADGMVFSDNAEVKATVARTVSSSPAAPKVAVMAGNYDPKNVRAWALAKGEKVGDRGRIPAPIINAYLAENGEDEIVEAAPKVEKEPTAKAPTGQVAAVPTVKPRIRPETIAYGFGRRRPEDGKHISEPLIAISQCGGCKAQICYCDCKTGPIVPKYLTNGIAEVALLVKPVV